jgi:hypothetical protein
VEASEMKSPLLEASAGDIVPANLEQSTPVMLVSFSVSRSYRGVRQQHVQIETGLGGGDCGFPFCFLHAGNVSGRTEAAVEGAWAALRADLVSHPGILPGEETAAED